MEFRTPEPRTVVFHVRIMDMIRAHFSKNSTGKKTCPIAQSVMRTFGLAAGEVTVARTQILIDGYAGPLCINLNSSPLMETWIENWDGGLFKLRRPFHFEVLIRQGRHGKVKRVWR